MVHNSKYNYYYYYGLHIAVIPREERERGKEITQEPASQFHTPRNQFHGKAGILLCELQSRAVSMNNYHYCFPRSGFSTLLQLHKLHLQLRTFVPHRALRFDLGRHAPYRSLLHTAAGFSAPVYSRSEVFDLI